MLSHDLSLKHETTSKEMAKRENLGDHEMEAAFHFIAFMPIENKLWKLDGLERQPMCLGIPGFLAFCLPLDQLIE